MASTSVTEIGLFGLFSGSSKDSLYCGMSTISLHRLANWNVDSDSPPLLKAGPTVAIRTTFVSPDKLVYNRRVNLLSRNGICDLFPFVMAEITFPNADRLVFIDFASSRRTPVELVFRTRSDPARSISVSFECTVRPNSV
jgi:hypothetical protein